MQGDHNAFGFVTQPWPSSSSSASWYHNHHRRLLHHQQNHLQQHLAPSHQGPASQRLTNCACKQLRIGNLIQDYITNPHVNREDRIWLWEHYGASEQIRSNSGQYDHRKNGMWAQAFVVKPSYIPVSSMAYTRVVLCTPVNSCAVKEPPSDLCTPSTK